MQWLLAWCVEEIKKLRGQLNDVAIQLGILSNTVATIIGTGAGGSGLTFSTGHGSPEGAVTGKPGDTYWDLDEEF